MFDDIARTSALVLVSTLAVSAATAQGAEDPFPAFQASASALLSANVPGADAMRLTFTNQGVAIGAAQMYGANATITVASFDARACRFAIKIENTAAQLPPSLLTGTCEPLARIPVAATELRPGDLIATAAIKEIETPLARLAATTIRKADQLIGKTPRQILPADQPILSQSIKAKAVIEKGQTVTLRFATAGFELTVQAQAQADAGVGEPIALLNPASRKTIDAVAIAPGLAEIKSPSAPRLAAN